MATATPTPTLNQAPDCLFGRTAHEQDIIAQLHRDIFADVPETELACLVSVAQEKRHVDGEVLATEDDRTHDFHILLEGKVQLTRQTGDQRSLFRKNVTAPTFMGEMTILARGVSHFTVTSVGPLRGLRVSEEMFWQLMASCPNLREAILKEFHMRWRGQAVMRSQEERLMALGTMTAGLMHELNNPGAAARRAASLLRDNLNRMHLLARKFSEHGHSESQRACLTDLQERVLNARRDVCMDSLQQSDREEELGSWLDEHGVEDAWNLAPTLVAIGMTSSDLQCLAAAFPGAELQEPLQWLEATASSIQQVALVEESVARVHDLAKAVKTYVHEGQGGQQSLAINESLHATLMLLKHKFREKQVTVTKEFGSNLPPLTCVCSGLNQVWTNLLDNAIDAVSQGGHISVRTWKQDEDLYVSIGDDGPGIPEPEQQHIFEPFYTTKPAGVGTGMGLGIAQRIVESYNGNIELHSKPGATEFIVRVPYEVATDA
ncbi:sensor histidine kinase [Terriglobus aquaticus]|uniref:histidine kinase n=1 Tax=Terriglobus aquaticus TaxID=940139 RepID=A0ABW9KK55_9BACT|nr:ATP-binding protein [Terriglobus aquaticus]